MDEKEYNEAFKRAKELHETGNALTKQQMEIVFPQLAESEDERVRRTLVEYFGPAAQLDFIRGVPIQKIRDWLEKQKINTEGAFGRGYDCGYEACLNSDGAEWFEKQKEQKSDVKDPFDDEQFRRGYEAGKHDAEREINTQLIHWQEIAHEKMMKKDFPDYDIKITTNDNVSELKASGDIYENIHNAMEQKPTERSLEDDHIIGFVYDLLNEIEWKDKWAMSKEECLRRLNNYRPQKPAEWSKEDEENFKWFDKFFRAESVMAGGRDIPQDKYLWFKSLRPQPKQEWSEEEKKMLARIIERGQSQIQMFETGLLPEHINWLKSLPERFNLQPEQEWSEEDENALKYIHELIGFGFTEKFFDAQTAADMREWLNEKFKSLRPQPHWKPSEEQMKVFDGLYHNYILDQKDYEVLKSLYNDLNRLK